MLTHIEISDFALIEKAVLTPGPGLMILTGETGAGKSILIDAISALGGERVSRDMVRHGQARATIEAVFHGASTYLPADLKTQLALEDEDEDLILSREVSAAGKSICRVNGRLVNIGLLQELAGWLIDIHGQHDQQAIFNTAIHLQLLDRFGGAPAAQALAAYQSVWFEYQNTLRELEKLGQDPAERARLNDMLLYQIREIESARLKSNEDDLLGERRRVVANAEKIRTALAEACDLLDGDSEDAVIGRLGLAIKNLELAGRHLPGLAQTGEQAREALYVLQNAISDLHAASEAVETDPGELERIDERLDLLFRLKKKYGGSLPAIQSFLVNAKAQLERLEDSESRFEETQKKQARLQRTLASLGGLLGDARRQAAASLESSITRELAGLNMKDVRFSVQFQTAGRDEPFTKTGLDKIEFLLSANPGEPLKPLARIASGGEASRIMLAIKSILAEADRVPVLIFDEIDSGVSGQTAGKVAEKLQILSRGRQVFCITHLAQIAAMADQHLLIEKTVADGVTRTMLRDLDDTDRQDELARLLSGGIGKATARELANQMLQGSRNFRLSGVLDGRSPSSAL